MRMIGHLESEAVAKTCGDFLYVNGIKNQVEPEPDGRWALWIHSEDELEKARQLLQSFLTNPDDSSVRQASTQANELKARENAEQEAAHKRFFDRDRIFPGGILGMGWLTSVLIFISVGLYLAMFTDEGYRFSDYFRISNIVSHRDLPEVRQGQVWRLLTPIFLHFGILHILFNMLWMRDLGSMVEARTGTLQLGLIVVGVGIASNLGQYYTSGPLFGGMSGVVYGLLGYVWMKGKFDPGSGLFLHQETVFMMLAWLALGYTGLLNMANTAHAVGLTMGVAWGYLSARLQI